MKRRRRRLGRLAMGRNLAVRPGGGVHGDRRRKRERERLRHEVERERRDAAEP